MPESYEVLLSDRAFRDLDDAYQRIAENAPQAASDWYEGFIEALLSLKEFPKRCQLAAETPRLPGEVRQLLYGKRRSYRALFTIRDDQVVVLHIRHTARDAVQPEDLI